MQTKQVFNKDPDIVFNVFNCPVCGEATGPKSTCFLKRQESDIENTRQNVSLQLFTPNCLFRQDYIYTADVNYPLVNQLVVKIQNIAGVNKVVAIAQSRMQIHIAPLYDKDKILKEIAVVYRTFIKSLSVTESIVLEKNAEPFTPRIITIKFPKGGLYEEYVTKHEEYVLFINYFNEIASGIEGVEIIDPFLRKETNENYK